MQLTRSYSSSHGLLILLFALSFCCIICRTVALLLLFVGQFRKQTRLCEWSRHQMKCVCIYGVEAVATWDHTNQDFRLFNKNMRKNREIEAAEDFSLFHRPIREAYCRWNFFFRYSEFSIWPPRQCLGETARQKLLTLITQFMHKSLPHFNTTWLFIQVSLEYEME